MKWKRAYLLPLLAVLILGVCLGIQKFAAVRDTLAFLRQVDENIVLFERLSGDLPTYRVNHESGEESYVVEASASGYGGVLTLLVKFDLNGTILRAVIADQRETPLYLDKVQRSGLLTRFTGQRPGDTLRIDDIDGVSGATLSARAIVSACKRASDHIGTTYLNMELPTAPRPPLDLVSVALLLFYAAALAMAHFSAAKKARPLLLVASVILLGFWGRAFLSFANFASLLTGNFPSFAERPIWHLLIFGVLLIVLLSGRNIYCAYLCPFGAVQEGVYRALHLSNITPDERLVHISKRVRWVVVWLALAIAFLLNQPGLAGYEPFGVFFGGQGNPGQWVIMVLVLFLGIWWLRLWCRYFCPVGAILDLLASMKNKIIKPKTPPQRSVCPQAEICPGDCAAMCEKKPFRAADKLFAVIIALFNLLILHTILVSILTL